jgi:GT2 family glycosyltransferase
MSSIVAALDNASPDVGGVAGRILPYSTQTVTERYIGAWVSQPDFETSQIKTQYCATPNAAFRRSALLAVGGFDGEQGFDDTDLGIRLQQAGYQVKYSRESLVRHRNPTTLKELYRHRRKYGSYSVKLALKHPELWGDPRRKGQKRQLFAETLRRIIADLTIKLAKSLISIQIEQPRWSPIVDATIAAANFHGFCEGLAFAKSRSAKGVLMGLAETPKSPATSSEPKAPGT